MGSKKLCLVILLFLASFHNNISHGVDARLPSSPDQTRYEKVFASLGMRCECCDLTGGQCRSKWVSTCSNLKCRPWKFL